VFGICSVDGWLVEGMDRRGGEEYMEVSGRWLQKLSTDENIIRKKSKRLTAIC
jgi:hypothetical protein